MANSGSSPDYSTIQQYGAWIIIATVLLGAAQFDSTSQLAATFAYLILVAAILWYGQTALANIKGISGNSPGPTTTTAGG